MNFYNKVKFISKTTVMSKTPIGGEMSWAFQENENKKRKKNEKVKSSEKEKILKYRKQKEKIQKTVEAHDELNHLRELIESGVVSQNAIEHIEQIAQDPTLEDKEVREIVLKIQEIHENEYMQKYIPKDLFLKKEDYLRALTNPQFAEKVLAKVNEVLWILAQHINPTSRAGINIFASFALFLVDKKLIQAQENHIDIKYSLLNRKK